jgi:hypothetical protein
MRSHGPFPDGCHGFQPHNYGTAQLVSWSSSTADWTGVRAVVHISEMLLLFGIISFLCEVGLLANQEPMNALYKFSFNGISLFLHAYTLTPHILSLTLIIFAFMITLPPLNAA